MSTHESPAVQAAPAPPGPDQTGAGKPGTEQPGVFGSVVAAAYLSETPLLFEDAVAAVESEVCGAVVSFSGVVRNHDGGKAVASLSYSSHPSARQVIARVARETAAAHRGVRLWVAHRVGPLAIGDAALVAAAASAHRAEAFAACAELVERVKAEVPIWKEQFFADGSTEWVGAGG